MDFDDLQRALRGELRRYGYELIPVRLSDLVHRLRLETAVVERPEHRRLETLMGAGDEARRKFGLEILAQLAVADVLQNRPPSVPIGERKAYLFRSFKRPEEIRFIRSVYGPSFFLIGAYVPLEKRIRYLTRTKQIKRDKALALLKRDQDELVKGGQNARGAFQLADVFVESRFNERQNLPRFLELVFGKPDVTPTLQEHAMFLASAAALRSGDLSRQVGASIVTAEGDVVAVGANDVPRYGGGLYWPGPDDARDAAQGSDSNEIEIVELARKLAGRLGNLLSNPREGLNALNESLREAITEFGRAMHAEMEALLACARNGVPVRGCDLYTTTFPCHNCAKHIVGAGIERVVFIEPYPKSRAFDLHRDAIASDQEPTQGRVAFRPFVGVGPRRYVDLFSMKLSAGYSLTRKVEGFVPLWERRNALPRIPAVRAATEVNRNLEILATQGLAKKVR